MVRDVSDNVKMIMEINPPRLHFGGHSRRQVRDSDLPHDTLVGGAGHVQSMLRTPLSVKKIIQNSINLLTRR